MVMRLSTTLVFNSMGSVRVRARFPLMDRYDPGAPPPPDVLELPRGPIVVPLEEMGSLAEEVMATACRLRPLRWAMSDIRVPSASR